jgi:thymidylate synthase
MLDFSQMGSAVILADSAAHATGQLAAALSNPGSVTCAEVERRGGLMREIPGAVTVEIRDPRKRISLLQGRKLNPWVSLAEFPWLMTGRNDVAWVANYLPRAADFSDDGRVWRAGYGPRLRNWRSKIDQLAVVVEALYHNRASRQAVISLWDPEEDAGASSRDIPCTNWLHFQVKNDALDLTVAMRSNDLIWGFSGVNVVNFTLLQEVVAALIDCEVGVYRHVCDNMHAYERHFDRLEPMALSPDLYDYILGEEALPFDDYGLGGVEGLRRLTEDLAKAMAYVDEARRLEPDPSNFPDLGLVAQRLGLRPDTFPVQWAFFMSLWPYAKEDVGTDGVWRHRLRQLDVPDWEAAALSWLSENKCRRSIIGGARGYPAGVVPGGERAYHRLVNGGA